MGGILLEAPNSDINEAVKSRRVGTALATKIVREVLGVSSTVLVDDLQNIRGVSRRLAKLLVERCQPEGPRAVLEAHSDPAAFLQSWGDRALNAAVAARVAEHLLGSQHPALSGRRR